MDRKEMTDEEFEKFKGLYGILMNAQGVCDPIEFFKRQRILLHALAAFALEPYYRELDRRKTADDQI